MTREPAWHTSSGPVSLQPLLSPASSLPVPTQIEMLLFTQRLPDAKPESLYGRKTTALVDQHQADNLNEPNLLGSFKIMTLPCSPHMQLLYCLLRCMSQDLGADPHVRMLN